jgi:hypothetical protein
LSLFVIFFCPFFGDSLLLFLSNLRIDTQIKSEREY